MKHESINDQTNDAELVEQAKKFLADIEKKELDSIAAEVADFFSNLNERGYGVLPSGSFIGHSMQLGWKIVKFQAGGQDA